MPGAVVNHDVERDGRMVGAFEPAQCRIAGGGWCQVIHRAESGQLRAWRDHPGHIAKFGDIQKARHGQIITMAVMYAQIDQGRDIGQHADMRASRHARFQRRQPDGMCGPHRDAQGGNPCGVDLIPCHEPGQRATQFADHSGIG